MKRMLDYYLTTMKIAIQTQFQYRTSQYFYMIGMIAEPVIYLVVWSTVALQQGGSVGGYTPRTFAAYYLVWTLVRNMNIVFTPYGWENRIRSGWFSMDLLRPIHPLNNDVAYFAGMKVVMIILWIPLGLVLSIFFRPELHPAWYQVIGFFFAIWGAYLIRTMLLSILGMITFFTTRVGAIFELYFALELIFSGRLVPMPLMPLAIQQIAHYLPFQWTFYFPINVLVSEMTPEQMLSGLGMQVVWIVIGWIAAMVMWRVSVRQFSAVGG